MTNDPKLALRDNLLRLVPQCPVEQLNPPDCPLYAVRRAQPARRLQWFDALTEDDLAYLSAYHCVCAQIKMEARQILRATDNHG